MSRPATRPDGGPWDPVLYCWFRQSRTEYAAACLTAEMSHWMLQLGLPPDLLVRATRVVADEVRHAALCHELCRHLGGPERAVPVSPEALRHADDAEAPLQWRLVTAALELAIEESVALPVFHLRLRNATEPDARRVIEIILKDEATHRAFAWALVDALVQRLGAEAVRDWARPRLAWWLRIYLMAASRGGRAPYSAAQRSAGLIDRDEHWQAMQRCVEEVVLPRLRERGLLAEDVELAALREEARARIERGGGPGVQVPGAAVSGAV
ncbi:MAG: ferritin-like domain-containing protein [Alphaproteobacteria bacterium]|nr:ferritin-like domain-containing protein [Alphaproteobacteria bacterium]